MVVDLLKFKEQLKVILAIRLIVDVLSDVEEKVYTRDRSGEINRLSEV